MLSDAGFGAFCCIAETSQEQVAARSPHQHHEHLLGLPLWRI
jgi:hypothetical protein